MAVGQAQITTPSYTSRIVTSDPSTNTIEGITPGGMANVMVVTTPIAFRWPVPGEVWKIKFVNNSWYLDEPVPVYSTASALNPTTASTTISDVDLGDAVINSPTGKIWVLGSDDGSTDFSFTEASFTPPTAPGTINSFAVDTAPSGWVLCNGSSYSTTGAAYVALYEVIGSTFDTGGTPTGDFSVPNTPTDGNGFYCIIKL